MEKSVGTEHRKKHRRRRADKPAISSWLTLSENVRGDLGKVSNDLYDDLFQSNANEIDNAATSEQQAVAISTWSPSPSGAMLDGLWTILPVAKLNPDEPKRQELPPATIQLSESSQNFRDLITSLQSRANTWKVGKEQRRVEIRVIDVKPLPLETVYVTLDKAAIDTYDEAQRRFGGGFDGSKTNGYTQKIKGKSRQSVYESQTDSALSKKALEQRLIAAIHQAMTSLPIARRGDWLSLPLPAHPITHVPFPPARIVYCEPVDQGTLSADTKIILNQVLSKIDPAVHDDADGVLSEHVISAAEDQSGDINNSSSDDSDSSENVISLSPPILSAKSQRPNGFSTPGSIYSSISNSTVRTAPGGYVGLFQVQGLLGKISDDSLSPKPSDDEDEEARVFVDVKMLLKLGCFSGDWIKVKAGEEKNLTREEVWAFGIPNDVDSLTENFRAVKVYGLPDLSFSEISQNPKVNPTHRRLSTSGVYGANRPMPVAWFSPILLANLGQPSFVRMSPLKVTSQDNRSSDAGIPRTKVTPSSLPPVAKEVTFIKIATPLSTERALQSGIFSLLKQHFEFKRRVVRQGDMVPLVVDIEISRMLNQSASNVETDLDLEGLLAPSFQDPSQTLQTLGVAWFQIGSITYPGADEYQQHISQKVWGGLACIEPASSQRKQAGIRSNKAPPAMKSTWEYYLGLRRAPVVEPFPDSWMTPFRPAPRTYTAQARRRLRELIAAGTSTRAGYLNLDPIVVLLHSTQRNIGKTSLAFSAALDVGVHLFSIDVYELLAESGTTGGDVKTEAWFKAKIDRAVSCGPENTVVLIRHVEALTGHRMESALKDAIKELKVLISTTTELEKVSDSVRALVTHELEIAAPDEGEREGILRNIVNESGMRLGYDVDLASVAMKTAALVTGDLVDIVERARNARQDRLEKLAKQASKKSGNSSQVLVRDVLISGGDSIRCVSKADFDIAVDAARKNFSDSIGAPKIPNVSWDDVGGLETVKDAVMETIQLPLERPELFGKGMKKRSGILFYGPPGTGKTLLAKAIATEFSLNFFSIKGPELLNMYIGESEANVRRVFQRARDAKPCVVFFDELDSVAPKRGNQGDSGGVMDRIVSQLLAELDGMSDGKGDNGGVFVIGATNRPDLLDQALLRPGRFDKMLYLGIPDTHDKQLTILKALTRKFAMQTQISLRRIAATLPLNYTGADLYALCSDAMLKAITRQAAAIERQIRALPSGRVSTAYFFDHLATPADIAVTVTEQDFLAAQHELVGSVSAKELAHYQRVRATFESATAATGNHRTKPPPTRLPAPVPVRPKLQSRSSTARWAPSSSVKTGAASDTNHHDGKGKTSRREDGVNGAYVASSSSSRSSTSDEDDDDDDGGYVTSNDFSSLPEREGESSDGNGHEKGNDKAATTKIAKKQAPGFTDEDVER